MEEMNELLEAVADWIITKPNDWEIVTLGSADIRAVLVSSESVVCEMRKTGRGYMASVSVFSNGHWEIFDSGVDEFPSRLYEVMIKMASRDRGAARLKVLHMAKKALAE